MIIETVDPSRIPLQVLAQNLHGTPKTSLTAATVRVYHITVLNKADLGRDVGISGVTANAWIGAMEASNQARPLEPWFSNRSKSITRSPKLFLADTGLLCFLLNISSVGELLRSPQLGQIWESMVFAELRKFCAGQGGRPKIYFLRDRSLEADFLIQSGQRMVLFEAKWTAHPRERDVQNLSSVETYLGGRYQCSKWVVCPTPHRFPLSGDIEAIPVTDVGTALQIPALDRSILRAHQ